MSDNTGIQWTDATCPRMIHKERELQEALDDCADAIAQADEALRDTVAAAAYDHERAVRGARAQFEREAMRIEGAGADFRAEVAP